MKRLYIMIALTAALFLTACSKSEKQTTAQTDIPTNVQTNIQTDLQTDAQTNAVNDRMQTGPADNETDPPMGYRLPDTYNSIEEFEAEESKKGTSGRLAYYVPELPTDQFELVRVTRRDKVYIALEYRVLSSLPEDKSLNDYETERLQTLICETSLFEDGEYNLQASYIKNGYKELEYEGKTYYRWDERAGKDNSGKLIGYEIVFLKGNTLIFMHLPAIDSFEEMIKYTAVIRRTVP